MVELVKIDDQFAFAIDPKLLALMRIDTETELSVTTRDGCVVITPCTPRATAEDVQKPTEYVNSYYASRKSRL